MKKQRETRGLFALLLVIIIAFSLIFFYNIPNINKISGYSVIETQAVKWLPNWLAKLFGIYTSPSNVSASSEGIGVLDVGRTIYADNQMTGTGFDLDGDCATYDITTRSCGTGSSLANNTLQKAADSVNAGDTVLVRGGTYTRPGGGSSTRVLQIKRSGEANNRITFSNYNNEQAIIDGENANYYAVQVGTSTLPGNYVTVNGFIVKNAANAMIFIQNSLGVIISHNTAYNDNLVFNEGTGNVDGGFGIVASGNVVDLIIEYNHVFNTEYGIRIVNSQNPAVRWNNVHHSHIECYPGPPGCLQDPECPEVYKKCANAQNHAQCISMADGVLGGVI